MLLCTLLTAGVFYVALRLRVTHRIEQSIAILQAEQAEAHKGIATNLEVLAQRLDSLERTVYGDVWPKLAALPATVQLRPSRIEVWQLNRDKELRARIDRLERWRWEHIRDEQEHP